jgi:hypothetical protein
MCYRPRSERQTTSRSEAACPRLAHFTNAPISEHCNMNQQNKCHTVSTTRLSTFILENSVLGYYAAYSGNSLPTFRDMLSVPHSTVKNLWSGSLRRVRWQFLTDVSGLPIGPTLALKMEQCVSKRRQGITITRCVIAQKSAVLIYFVAEAWNLTFILGYTYEPWESKKSRRGK